MLINKKMEQIKTNHYLKEITEITYEISEYSTICNNDVYINFKHDLGMPDYALKSRGGNIIDSSKSFCSKKPPSLILNNKVEPGNCWITVAKDAFVEISISEKVEVVSISIEHSSKLLVRQNNRTTAPKFGYVYSKLNYIDDYIKIGSFHYEINCSEIQLFPVYTPSMAQFIKIEFIENYGSHRMCIYRIRVHGNIENFVSL
ncbi:SUN domain-containing protein 3 [Intoshia linei]|uniref:SUN domain-containing protein 3 n=1 Tax=Intoshia linei TaxID=1819745 RepID=A0A177BAY9_9BILA|nr:SUN domain-containing protein 3 [Intoshia linei]